MKRKQTDRPHLNFVPSFDSLAGWAAKTAYKNLWRVKPTHDFDDLMGEARYVFVKCAKMYPEIRSPAHFAALFRTAFTNRIHRLALAETKDRPFIGVKASDLSDNENIFDCFKGRTNCSDLTETILRTQGAPEPILRLLKRLQEKEQLVPAYGYKRARTEAMRMKIVNEWLCVIAKQPPRTDMLTMVRNWLYGETAV